MPRVPVDCEYSGVTRDAYTARGWDAWSCDILPTESPGQHIRGGVLEVIGDGWDLLIAHPPCTYLSMGGIAHWNKQGRKEKRDAAMDFFMEFANAPVPRICIENPRGHANNEYRSADQTIHPYYFGEPHCKRTCLWLKNLPRLEWLFAPTLFDDKTACDNPEPCYISPSGSKKYSFMERNRSQKARSKSFLGIAKAMADQWGNLEPLREVTYKRTR